MPGSTENPSHTSNTPYDVRDRDINDIADSSIDIPLPSKSAQFSTAIGDDGTGAILGLDHDLLLFSSYTKGSWRLVRGYSQCDELGPLLAQSQGNESDGPNLAWGLHLQDTAQDTAHIERGFMDCRWPTQKKKTVPTSMAKKATTYVKDGRLIQAVAIASQTPITVSWTIGGKIQLIQRARENSTSFGTGYSVGTWSDDQVLSARCNLFCVDVQLFINGLPQKLERSGAQPKGSKDKLKDFADISCAGSLPFQGSFFPKILVAVFTLRDLEQDLEPEYRHRPDWTEIKEHLGLSEQEKDYSLPLDLWGNSKIDLIPHIVLRNVEQLLSAAALPDSAQPGSHKFYLINSLVGYGMLEINYEATFWHIRLLTRVLDEIKRQNDDDKKLLRVTEGTENPRAAEEIKKQIVLEQEIKYKEVLEQEIKYKRVIEEDRVRKRIINNNSYSVRISNVIAGTLRWLFFSQTMPHQSSDRLFRILTLFYALRHQGNPQIDELQSDILSNNEILRQLNDFDLGERKDSVAYLLQWLHGRAIMSEVLRGKFPIFALYQPETEEVRRCEDGALARISVERETPYQRIIREEKWNQLALLSVELFENVKETKPFVIKLINEVAKRLKERETEKLGDLPPWGYRCLDHSSLIDLAIAKHKIENWSTDLDKSIHDAYIDCLYFLRSDHSFLKSWDLTEPTWTSDHWNLDCSSLVSSSFLSMATMEPATTPNPQEPTDGSAIEPKFGEILEALRDITQPEGKHYKFPWKDNLRVYYTYSYPPFMYISLRTREASTDRVQMDERIEKIKQNSSNILATKLLSDRSNLFPNQWSSDQLKPVNLGGGQICVSDFPFKEKFDSNKLSPLLEASRIAKNAAYRIITVDRLPKELLVTYINFVHSDAWDTVVDYFGSASVFRESLESSENHDATGEVTWSITIPHFILKPPESTDVVRNREDFPPKFDSGNLPTADFPGATREKKTLWDACISICMTGDSIGDFWTSSILGTINSRQKDGIDENKPQPDVTEKIRKVIERYKYDKYSARNLVFILHLTEICQTISKRYDDILDALKDTVDLEDSSELYPLIVTASTESTRAIERSANTVKRAARALRVVLWGMGLLERLDNKLKTALPVIDSATRHVETNLSKRRKYWLEKLEKFEQVHVWAGFRSSFAGLEACKSRIGDITRSTSGVKDNLIFLSNMAATQAILATTQATLISTEATQNAAQATKRATEATQKAMESTKEATEATRNTMEATKEATVATQKTMEATRDASVATRHATEATRDSAKDTSNMKIIAILTTLFLPFTFVAVFLTTPMFKWPDPAEGQIFVTAPFAIYWGASVALTVVVGAVMLVFRAK